jgi:hypothetical protein
VVAAARQVHEVVVAAACIDDSGARGRHIAH